MRRCGRVSGSLALKTDHGSSDVANAANVRRLVLIRNNTLMFPLLPVGPSQLMCQDTYDFQLYAFCEGFLSATKEHGIKFPDAMFLLNVDDGPPCDIGQADAGISPCHVPFVSVGKAPGVYTDLVAPSLHGPEAKDVVARSLPWDAKVAKAFFRGAPSCGRLVFERPVCARTWVARLSSTNYSDRIDAGLVEYYFSPEQQAGDAILRDGHGALPVAEYRPRSVLPGYRYLLALDGHVAPYRMSMLLATDSVVLKQHSDWVEWHYRSLRPYVHYVPIFKTSRWDVFGAMTWVDDHQEEAQAIARRAQRFALRYATYPARLAYWAYVVQGYRELFEDQEQWLEQLRGLDGAAAQQLLLNAVP